MQEDNEEIFVNKIEKFLKERGFKTFREVIPDQCSSWEKPFRVDLIFYHDSLGYIAVEAKNMNTLGCGGVFADAFEQIKKYKQYTYLKGNLISKWCIAPAYNLFTFKENWMDNDRTLTFIKTFFRRYDISFLEYKEYDNPQRNRLIIDGLTPNKIMIGDSAKGYFILNKSKGDGNES